MSIKIENRRRTAAIIDLSAIEDNCLGVRRMVGNEVKICAVVKADAYGHGAVPVSRLLEDKNLVEYFGVGMVEEGIELRSAGIELPVLIMESIMPDEMEMAIRNDLRLTLYEEAMVAPLNVLAEKMGIKIKVHIKVDTGMGGSGCAPEKAAALVESISKAPGLEMEGFYSHFASSDAPDQYYSRHQMGIFSSLLNEIERTGMTIPVKHLANSGGILGLKESYFDMVRPGIMLYGHYPSADVKKSVPLRSAMTLRSEILAVKRMRKGSSISYGRTYVISSDSYVGVIPVGYADGLNRLLSNRHMIRIAGKLYPIAGRVCMDRIFVDLGDDFYPVGTEVIIFGHKDSTASHIARTLGTIPYEVTSAVGKRVERIYLQKSD